CHGDCQAPTDVDRQVLPAAAATENDLRDDPDAKHDEHERTQELGQHFTTDGRHAMTPLFEFLVSEFLVSEFLLPGFLVHGNSSSVRQESPSRMNPSRLWRRNVPARQNSMRVGTSRKPPQSGGRGTARPSNSASRAWYRCSSSARLASTWLCADAQAPIW